MTATPAEMPKAMLPMSPPTTGDAEVDEALRHLDPSASLDERAAAAELLLSTVQDRLADIGER